MSSQDKRKDKQFFLKSVWKKRAGFSCLRHIAVSDSGEFYISDTGAKQVFIHDKNGKQIGQLGKDGLEAYSLTFSSDGKAVVAAIDCVKVFDVRNQECEMFSFGKGEVGGATGVACTSLEQYIVSDAWCHKILTFNSNGELIDSFGSKGESNSKFKYPYYVCVDKHDNTVVSDHMNCCIKVFDPNGIFLAKHKTCGGTKYFFGRPRCISVDVSGNIYVADTDNDRIGVIPCEEDKDNDEFKKLEDLLTKRRFMKPGAIALSRDRMMFAISSTRQAELAVFQVMESGGFN